MMYILAFILRNRKWFAIAGAAIAVLLAAWWVVDSIGDRREEKVRAEHEAAQRAAEAKAAADTILLQDHMAGIDASVSIDMEAINAVRTVWRDKVVYKAVDVYRDNPDCRVPAGLLSEINAAAGDYARAARQGGPAVPAAKPAP